jgi:hypothetical protein
LGLLGRLDRNVTALGHGDDLFGAILVLDPNDDLKGKPRADDQQHQGHRHGQQFSPPADGKGRGWEFGPPRRIGAASGRIVQRAGGGRTLVHRRPRNARLPGFAEQTRQITAGRERSDHLDHVFRSGKARGRALR